MFKKESIWIHSLRVNGFDQQLILRLEPTFDKKAYNDYITIERSLGKGKGYEVVFTLPFKDIKSISYKKPFLFGLCTISIDIPNGDARLKDIKMERDFYNKSSWRKIVRIWEDNKQL